MARAQTAGTGGSTTSGSTGSMTAQLLQIGNEDYPDPATLKTPINGRQCEANAALHISLNNVPANSATYLEAWVGTNCQQSDRSTRTPSDADCTYITNYTLNTGETIITDFQVPVTELCSKDGDRVLYILPVNQMMGTEQVSNYASLTLKVDTVPPNAPTGVKGGAGQTEIPVSWSQPSGNPYYYWVVVDRNAHAGGTDAGSGADCSSDVLVEGEAFDPQDPPAGVYVKHINQQASSATLSGSEVGSDLAAVAVIAEDFGHNRSVLSNVACLRTVATTGFWQDYKDMGGTAEQGCACSTPGARSRTADFAALGSIVFGLGLWWTRRRR